MEKLNHMLLKHNRLSGATLTLRPAIQGQDLMDLYRNDKLLVPALTHEKALYTVSVLECAARQDIEEKISELESLLAAIHGNDDCLYSEDVDAEIAAWKAKLND